MDDGIESTAPVDSMADMLAPAQATDPLERDEVFHQVARSLFEAELPPRRVGRYELGERLGGGGQGVVYAGFDPQLQRRVAIKILQASTTGASSAIRREALALARLSHPNVIAVNDVGGCRAGVFIVMQYVPGRTVLQWLAEARNRPWRDTLEVFAAAGRGLVAAHEAGIVHRDFKPSNVWMGDDGVVRLLDFGLAQSGVVVPTAPKSDDFTSVTDSVSELDDVAGTPPYMAPEQHEGHPATAASDQYAFCVSLYEALYGVRPFTGASLTALVLAKQGAIVPGPPPGSAAPKRLWRIVQRGLDPDPRRRWPSIAALVETLERMSSSRRGTSVPLVVGLGASMFAGAAWMSPDDDTCERDADVEDVWSDARRDAVEQAFGSTDLAFADDTARRVQHAVDGYVERWTLVRAEACGRIGQDAVADQTLRCLTRLRDELDDRLALLEAPSIGTVEHADELIGALFEPQTCASNRWEPGPGGQGAHRAIREARALGVSGRVEAAVLAARSAAADASQVDDEGLWAEASLVLGRLLSSTGELDEAIDELERAYLWGLSRGRDRIAFEAAVELVDLFASRRQDLSRCRTWVERAAAMVGRLPDRDDPAVAGRLALARAKQEFTSGDYASGLEHASEASDLLEQAGDPRMVSATTTLARLLANHDRGPEARRAAQRALALAERLRGPDHPITVGPRMTLATMRDDDPTEALALFQDNLRIVRNTYGDDDLRVAEVRRNMGTLYARQGRNADAVREYRAALAAQRAQLPEYDSLLAQTLYNLTVPLRAMDEDEEAISLGREAVRIAEAAIGPDHPTTAIYVAGVGESLMSSDPRAALPMFERALRTFDEEVGDRHVLYAVFEASLGQCHRLLGDLARSEEALQHSVMTLQSVRGADPLYIDEALHQLALTRAARGQIQDGVRG